MSQLCDHVPMHGVDVLVANHTAFFLWSVLVKFAFENWYRIFRTIRRTYNPLFFSKMERAPYSPVRLMCGSGCALSPNSEQILCCNNRCQR